MLKTKINRFTELIEQNNIEANCFGIENKTMKQANKLTLEAMRIFGVNLESHPKDIHNVFLTVKKLMEDNKMISNTYYTFYHMFYLGNGLIRNLIDTKYGDDYIFRYNTDCFGGK